MRVRSLIGTIVLFTLTIVGCGGVPEPMVGGLADGGYTNNGQACTSNLQCGSGTVCQNGSCVSGTNGGVSTDCTIENAPTVTIDIQDDVNDAHVYIWNGFQIFERQIPFSRHGGSLVIKSCFRYSANSPIGVGAWVSNQLGSNYWGCEDLQHSIPLNLRRVYMDGRLVSGTELGYSTPSGCGGKAGVNYLYPKTW